jgi:hypothetical protein
MPLPSTVQAAASERPFRPSVVSFVGSSFRSCGPSVTRLRVSDQPPSDDPSGLRPAGLPALRRRTGCDIPPATCPAFAFLVLRPSAARPPSVSPVPRLSGFPYSAGPFAPFPGRSPISPFAPRNGLFGPRRIAAPEEPDRLPWRSRQLETAFRFPGAAARFRTTSPGSSFLACFFVASGPNGKAVRL